MGTDDHGRKNERVREFEKDIQERVEQQLQSPAAEGAERELDRVAAKVDRRFDEIDSEPVDKFGRVFALILLTILTTPLASFGPGFLILTFSIQVFTVFMALRTSHVRPSTLLVVMSFALIAFIGVVAAIIIGSEHVGRLAFGAAMLPMIVIVPIAITRRLMHHTHVSIHTVWGALSIYLIIGLFYAVLYGTIAATDPPFFAQSSRAPLATDFIYFSFVTLTTVGYGDLTAAKAIGQMLAISEALIGQIFLVTIVALLVSRIRPEQRTIGGPRARLRGGRTPHPTTHHADEDVEDEGSDAPIGDAAPSEE